MLTVRQHIARTALFGFLLLSPIGAPLVGLVLVSVCREDRSIEPDGPIGLGFHYCGMSRPIERGYQSAIFLPMLAMSAAGPLIGGMVAMLWVVGAAAIAVTAVWHLLRAVSRVTIERL